MTGAEIKTMFETIVDDTLDADFTYQLMNKAKDELEALRPWEYLKKSDATQSTTVGGTYTTQYTLPTDFREMLKVFVTDTEYEGVPFEDQIRFKDSAHRYFIDHVNSKLHITGAVSTSETITQLYLYQTDDIAAGTSPKFPSRFHPVLAFMMARIYSAGTDGDEVNFRMSPEQERQAQMSLDALITWDARLKQAAMARSTRSRPKHQPNASNVAYWPER